MTYTYDFCVQLLGNALRDVEGRVEVNVTNWGRPAQTYGPAEKCHPAEGVEVELGAVEVIIGSTRHGITGFTGWVYRTLDETNPDDAWLARLIRDAIDPAGVAETALDQRAERDADAEERRSEARREEAWT